MMEFSEESAKEVFKRLHEEEKERDYRMHTLDEPEIGDFSDFSVPFGSSHHPTHDDHSEEPIFASLQNPGRRAKMLLRSYRDHCASGRFTSAYAEAKLATDILARLVQESDETEGDDEQNLSEYSKWCVQLMEAFMSKGVALRKLGYLSLAVQSYHASLAIYAKLHAVGVLNEELGYQAEMLSIMVAKNCGVAYMLLGKPEMSLPMIERATTMQQLLWDSGLLDEDESEYFNLLACYTNRFQVLITLQDWPRAAFDFVHIHKLFAAQAESEETSPLDKVTVDFWQGLCTQIRDLRASKGRETYAMLIEAIAQRSLEAAADAIHEVPM